MIKGNKKADFLARIYGCFFELIHIFVVNVYTHHGCVSPLENRRQSNILIMLMAINTEKILYFSPKF